MENRYKAGQDKKITEEELHTIFMFRCLVKLFFFFFLFYFLDRLLQQIFVMFFLEVSISTLLITGMLNFLEEIWYSAMIFFLKR